MNDKHIPPLSFGAWRQPGSGPRRERSPIRECLARPGWLTRVLMCVAVLCPLVSPVHSADEKPAPASGFLEAGVGRVDITPEEPILLRGSPVPKPASGVNTRLSVRALVLSAGSTKVAIVTVDTLKYPYDLARQARAKVEQATGIPATHVIVCASHTHSGPLWSYYDDRLVDVIPDAVTRAVSDLAPCTAGVAEGVVDGVSQCRRVIKDGHAWNRWQLPPGEDVNYPSEGPHDPAFDVLALTGRDGKHKAILYNFACHAAANVEPRISADFPGDVAVSVRKLLGYEVSVFFLTGACGDVNVVGAWRPRGLLGEQLGGEILRCLRRLSPIADPSLAVEFREFPMPGRENPQFQEAEITRNWPAQLEHYRKAFDDMKTRAKPTYPYPMTGIRLGDDFALVTNATELFCSIGMRIKEKSPFQRTMIVEQTNGAYGYVPSANAFAGGSYETWFGEHSLLAIQAGDIIERQSLDILKRLSTAK